MRIVSSAQLRWKEHEIRFQDRKLAAVVQDKKYPAMWRIDRLDGTLSDMVNLSRAKDAARGFALSVLNSADVKKAPMVTPQTR
jgi:hypothetical protein